MAGPRRVSRLVMGNGSQGGAVERLVFGCSVMERVGSGVALEQEFWYDAGVAEEVLPWVVRGGASFVLAGSDSCSLGGVAASSGNRGASRSTRELWVAAY